MGSPKSNSVTASTAMSTELRKHVATVHVGGDLGLLDRKLVNVLALNAYDELLTKKTHSIPVRIMSEMLGFDSKNTDALKKALKKITTTPIEFDLLHASGESDWDVSTLLSHAGIKNGVCTYEYSNWLANKLANPDIYLLININVQKQFNGAYALALYENCLRFKRTGSTGWISVEVWRKLLGAEASTYDEFKHFNGEVIKKAVKEVNTVSNIIVTPEYRRANRRVTDIRFLIEENPQASVYDGSDDSEHAAIRSSETYRRLRDLGIADRLATLWIQQEPDRAAKAVDYVEDKRRRNQIKGNVGGYLRTVFEGGSSLDVDSVPLGSKTAQPSVGDRERETEAEQRAAAISAAIKALTTEERHAYVMQFIADGGKATSYSEANATFRNVLERTAYTSWLRGKIGATLG
ncbi:plasmid replication initiation protein [Burkholderia cepacia]|nr:replication initiation protein [Burkholderia cenocepacia]KVS51656.1 plasmid replication initiation protein [Burkholderia cepacia]KVS69900.1 plasmid replication initiation protein [Burkholderia cepacia]MCW3504558.1 replication initiation protein [Burkholderia cenocepacia]MCW3512020.1 replication initiation protein [Burkholderia cenocepacia]MCW3519647.1 replication initiation protein [Burkholderia cenocepacia]